MGSIGGAATAARRDATERAARLWGVHSDGGMRRRESIWPSGGGFDLICACMRREWRAAVSQMVSRAETARPDRETGRAARGEGDLFHRLRVARAAGGSVKIECSRKIPSVRVAVSVVPKNAAAQFSFSSPRHVHGTRRTTARWSSPCPSLTDTRRLRRDGPDNPSLTPHSHGPQLIEGPMRGAHGDTEPGPHHG